MRIRKFNESDEKIIISSETLNVLISKLESIANNLDENKLTVVSVVNTLSNFKSKSKSSNTQIDDSYINLEIIESKINDIIGLLDTTLNNLKDYNQSGERFLY